MTNVQPCDENEIVDKISADKRFQDNVSHTNDTGFGQSEGSTISSSVNRLNSLESENELSGFSENEESLELSDDNLSSSENYLTDSDDTDFDNEEKNFDNLRFSALNHSTRSYPHVQGYSNNHSGTIKSVSSATNISKHYNTNHGLPYNNEVTKRKLTVDKQVLNTQENNLKQQMNRLNGGTGKQVSGSTSILQTIGRFFRRNSPPKPVNNFVRPNTPGESCTFKDGDVGTEWNFESRDSPSAFRDNVNLQRREFQRSKRSSQRNHRHSIDESSDLQPKSRLQSYTPEFGFGNIETDFSSQSRSKSMFALNTIGCNVERKVLHFSPMADLNSTVHSSNESISYENDERAISRTSSVFSEPKPLHAADPALNVTFELRDPSKGQCASWKSEFAAYTSVKVRCQYFYDNFTHDAIVIPGNSFGFLDGEPEVQFTNIFGWSLQAKIREEICQKHDGELLVGQAVKVKLEGEELNEIPEIISEESFEREVNAAGHDDHSTDHDSITSENKMPRKYFIYVPVMRVPLHVQDTVNAYLSFRAVLRTIRDHNQHCEPDERINSVLCPALCDGFGRMPARRIATQMKTAYDAFVLRNQPELLRPPSMGYMATHHVDLTSNKTGNWC